MIVPVPDTHRTIDAVWKLESAKIIAGLTRMVHDVGLAEELAQDALVAALEQWPVSGIPDNPGAWLTTTAKRRAVDHIRRDRRLTHKQEQLAHELEQHREPEQDDVLRLMLISCHPVLPTEARTALTLRLLGGLTAEEIARAFLVTATAIAQRIAAAKRTLAERRVPFDLPDEDELTERLSSVLEVIYLIFNEGYSATSGDDLMRPGLCLEALRLGRLLAELAPQEAEAHALVALMEIQASRSAARTGPSGEPVQLHEQNRGRWDRLLIRRGFTAMLRARQVGGTSPGPYLLQAAIAVCHAQAPTAEDTDWARIAACTRRWRSCCRPRSSSSTGPCRSGWPTGPRRAWTWSTPCSPIPHYATTTSCRASGVTCWRASTGTTRRGWSSTGRPPSPGTPPNAPSWSGARTRSPTRPRPVPRSGGPPATSSPATRWTRRRSAPTDRPCGGCA